MAYCLYGRLVFADVLCAGLGQGQRFKAARTLGLMKEFYFFGTSGTVPTRTEGGGGLATDILIVMQ